MQLLRDLVVLFLVGLYLLVALSTQAAPLPLVISESWSVTTGASIAEVMVIGTGKLNKKPTWFIEYFVGDKQLGHKVLSAEYYEKFSTEVRNHLRKSKTKTLLGHISCEDQVLIHHQVSSKKISKSEVCPSLLGKADLLNFEDWYRRWKNLVVRNKYF